MTATISAGTTYRASTVQRRVQSTEVCAELARDNLGRDTLPACATSETPLFSSHYVRSFLMRKTMILASSHNWGASSPFHTPPINSRNFCRMMYFSRIPITSATSRADYRVQMPSHSRTCLRRIWCFRRSAPQRATSGLGSTGPQQDARTDDIRLRVQ